MTLWDALSSKKFTLFLGEDKSSDSIQNSQTGWGVQESGL